MFWRTWRSVSTNRADIECEVDALDDVLLVATGLILQAEIQQIIHRVMMFLKSPCIKYNRTRRPDFGVSRSHKKSRRATPPELRGVLALSILVTNWSIYDDYVLPILSLTSTHIQRHPSTFSPSPPLLLPPYHHLILLHLSSYVTILFCVAESRSVHAWTICIRFFCLYDSHTLSVCPRFDRSLNQTNEERKKKEKEK